MASKKRQRSSQLEALTDALVASVEMPDTAAAEGGKPPRPSTWSLTLLPAGMPHERKEAVGRLMDAIVNRAVSVMEERRDAREGLVAFESENANHYYDEVKRLEAENADLRKRLDAVNVSAEELATLRATTLRFADVARVLCCAPEANVPRIAKSWREEALAARQSATDLQEQLTTAKHALGEQRLRETVLRDHLKTWAEIPCVLFGLAPADGTCRCATCGARSALAAADKIDQTKGGAE